MPGITYDHVVRILKDFDGPSKRILEIGCGMMQYRDHLVGNYEGLDLPSSKHIEEVPHILASAESIPRPSDSYDLIFTVASLVWIDNVNLALSECHRVLRKGGSIVVFDYRKAVGDRLHKEDSTLNKHSWNFEELKEKLTSIGFESQSVQRIDENRYPSIYFEELRRWPPRWKSSVKRLVGKSDWLVVSAIKT